MRNWLHALKFMSALCLASAGCGQKAADPTTADLPVPYFAGKTPVDIVDAGGGKTYLFNLDESLDTFLKEFEPLAEKDGWTKRRLPNGTYTFRQKPDKSHMTINMFDKLRAEKGKTDFLPSKGCLVAILKY